MYYNGQGVAQPAADDPFNPLRSMMKEKGRLSVSDVATALGQPISNRAGTNSVFGTPAPGGMPAGGITPMSGVGGGQSIQPGITPPTAMPQGGIMGNDAQPAPFMPAPGITPMQQQPMQQPMMQMQQPRSVYNGVAPQRRVQGSGLFGLGASSAGGWGSM